MTSISHNTDQASSEKSQQSAAFQKAFDAAFEKAFTALVEAAEHLPADMDFAVVEMLTADRVCQLGCRFLRAAIEQRDDHAPYIERKGKRWRRVGTSPREIITQLGTVKYVRSRYRRRGKPRSIFPVDWSLGLLHASMTRPAGKLAAFALAQNPVRDVAKLFARSVGMSPSPSTIQRLMDGLQGNLEPILSEVLGEIRTQDEEIPETAVSVAVSLDGAMVPLRPGEYKGPEKPEKKSVDWREAACGTVTFHDANGNRLRTITHARMPEQGKVSLKRMLADECKLVWEQRPDLKLVALADGAADNWSFLETLHPDFEVADYWHAREYLREVSACAASPNAWFKQRETDLYDDPNGADKVIRALCYLLKVTTSEAKREKIETALTYFRNQRRRMQYRQLRDLNLPIGSGVVEAANKSMIAERLRKTGGRRWSLNGGQSILTFRALSKSDRFDHAWDRLMAKTVRKTMLAANENPSDQCLALAA